MYRLWHWCLRLHTFATALLPGHFDSLQFQSAARFADKDHFMNKFVVATRNSTDHTAWHFKPFAVIPLSVVHLN